MLSLGAQAGMMLAAEAGAEGRRPRRSRAPGSIISILEMLEDKTAGRRTPEESRLLEELLFELRMAYVAAGERA